MKQALNITLVMLMALSALTLHAATLPGIPEFIDEMVAKHQFKRAELETAFARAQYIPAVIEAISRPATIRPWQDYRANFVNPERIKRGLKFWKQYQRALLRAEQKYGVPQHIILAVIGVETVYGRDVGTYRTLDALATLAFDYPPRAVFFRSELENYLLLAREQQFNLLAIRGSYAGALGIPQFMPSSYRAYAVDFNLNHRIDLMHEPRDAIGSVASYLKDHGWANAATGEKHSQNKAMLQSLPVALPVKVSEEVCLGEIVTPRTVLAWQQVGITSGADLTGVQGESARLLDFTVGQGKEFWLAFNNFEVIRSYNNSDFYAMSVLQLGDALKAARQSVRSK